MDSSKQGFAMGLQHLANLLLAMLFSEAASTKAGACIWYITNVFIATVCGLVIVASYMKLQALAVERFGWQWLRSGEYGDPPAWSVWLAQMLVWSAVCCVEKLLTAAVVIMPLRGLIDELIAPLERPLKPYPKTELVLVMVVLPTLLASVWSWVADSLIKGHAGGSRDGTVGLPAAEVLPLKDDSWPAAVE
eukprot:CAMPEP_0179079002 /NCGR_PEP_ID=MMETSP0796-20121207/35418_1 /TAXON_ID=73915 /ORGANISM="Pyrodinium bahamense, Strain pbaha01" /LENGTH=190 /DNA_ID=CAMNT_0020776325 /DNA_START=199 /DNA_END=771 /DNA_ORIENTATION=-